MFVLLPNYNITMFISYIYHRKNGAQQSRKALIIIPSVRAALRSRRIVVMVDCSTWILGRGLGIWLICKCLSKRRAATLDLKRA